MTSSHDRVLRAAASRMRAAADILHKLRAAVAARAVPRAAARRAYVWLLGLRAPLKMTPLHRAVAFDKADMVTLLLDRGANVNAEGVGAEPGFTPPREIQLIPDRSDETGTCTVRAGAYAVLVLWESRRHTQTLSS